MVQGKFKSGHYRRVQRRLPGGGHAEQFRERQVQAPHCATCGKQLHGIPRLGNVEAKKAAKTTKRPERPFGGVLCSACMRAKIIEQNRK